MQTLKKKLVIFMPAMEGGGVEKNIIIISNYLANYIKNIELITYDTKFNKYFDKRIKIINFVKSSKIKSSKYYKYFICLLLLVRSFFQKKETFIFAFQANIYCIILSIIFGKNIITRSNSSPSGWSKNYLKKLIFLILLKYPKNIIVNSKAFKKELDKKFKVNSKMIYNPLNKNEVIEKSKKKLKFSFFRSNKTLKIINVSRFTDQKDHITLLRAFLIISKQVSAKLLLIGYGSNKNKILNFIKINNLEKKVKIMDFSFNPYKYIYRSDLFILTSLYEGLPNVLLETMSLKKYIISSECPTGPSEILENGKYGSLFPVKDYRKLSNLVINFSKNRKKYNHKIVMAYKSLDRFDKEKNCKSYLLEVQKLMKIN